MGKEYIKYHLVDRDVVAETSQLENLSVGAIKKVRKFHESFKQYSVTPLYRLKNLSKYYGVGEIFVKDESFRFGLNAFKVLGGSYAIGKYLADKLGMDINDLSFEYLSRKDIKEKLGVITFVTATDGNHGRGIAWAANKLGQKSVVYMPRGSSQIRLEAIRKEGAHAEIIEGNYDDAVRLSEKMAKKYGWIVLQDTAWPGYEKVPTWIMEGYGTMIDETMEQLSELGINKISHVFLQAGVGSFAGSILGYLTARFRDARPITLIMEPRDADCLYRSSLEGQIEIVTGDMPTIMAGLACGEPNAISYKILDKYADGYLSCLDEVAAKGMRVLAAPLRGDPQIISGESGALGIGVISHLMQNKKYRDLKDTLKLNEESVILMISTEGDTDPNKYREIIWGVN